MSNTDVVIRLAREKHLAARHRVLDALRHWPENRVITFTAVSQRAKVSKTFLYDARQADLAAEIRRLHAQPLTCTTSALPEKGKSDGAKDAQIARLQERVRQHVQEIERLRAENALLYGRLAERH